MSVTQTWLKCENAEFNAQWERGSGTVSAYGELDAANADLLAEYVARCVKHCHWLTLDLTGLKFIGTAGFSALHRINVVCSGPMCGGRWYPVWPCRGYCGSATRTACCRSTSRSGPRSRGYSS